MLKNKIQWEKVHTGVRCKSHPTRKHGIKPDKYFAIRYQTNGKACESGLGWASEGWTETRAIAKRLELIEIAKQGQGVKTNRQVLQEHAKAEHEKKEIKKDELKAQEKKELSLTDFFNSIYYPQIQKEKIERTHKREKSLFENWIKKHVGHLPFKDITKADIENIFYGVIDAKKSIRTAEYSLTTLKQIWREAKVSGCANDMPIISKSLKKRISQNNNARIRFLTHEEAETLLDELKRHSIDLYEKAVLSLHCGLRAGEVLSLTWAQVDIEHGILNIIESKGKDRSVYMSDEVKIIIQGKKQGSPNKLIFPGRGGIRSEQISQVFRTVANKLFNKGVKDRRHRVSFHTLRHTYASWLVMEGIDLYLVQKTLGHSTIQVTERYSHLAPEKLKTAAGAINKSVLNHKHAKVIPFHKKA